MHIVISDPHVSPGQNLERFDWLGKMIRKEKPDKVICIGDFTSLDSCSSHAEPGSATDVAAPTLQQDAEACLDAQKRMFYQQFGGKRFMLEGNHEDRYARWAELNPKQASVIDFHTEMGFNKYWDRVIRYKNWLYVDGIGYTHVPHNIMGRPVGGMYAARTVALNASTSVIFGHSHSMQAATVPLYGDTNEARMALIAPAFMPEGHIEPYARGNQTGWQYGVLRVFPATKPNRPFTYEWVSIERLQELYG